MSLEKGIAEALREAATAPHVTTGPTDDTWYDEVQAREEQQRLRRRMLDLEQGPLVGASKVFQRQVRWRAKHRPDLVEAMATTVAMTILPGDHQANFDQLLTPRTANGKETPRVPLVNIRFPRLMVAYRFPEGTDPHSGIAVVGYKMSVGRDGKVRYGGVGNAEFAKNAAIKPHPGARAAAIDPNRDAVLLDATLALDWAMECAVTGRLETVEEFRLPPVLFGFPTSYDVRPETTEAMRTRLQRTFTVGGPSLRAFVAGQGGQVLSITDLPGGRKNLNMEVLGNLMQVRIPRWAVLQPTVLKGAVLAPGTLLADVPRFEDPNVETIRSAVGDVEWVLRRLLDEATETVVIDDKVYNKASQRLVVEPRTWKCVPAELVPGQVTRAVGKYLDLRGFLGRELPDQNDTTRDRTLTYSNEAIIQVKQLDQTVTGGIGLRQESSDSSWSLDLGWLGPDFAWLQKQRDGAV